MPPLPSGKGGMRAYPTLPHHELDRRACLPCPMAREACAQYSAARRAPIAVNARNNPEPQQHALHALQPSDVGLSEAHTDALFLVPLNATVSIEESAQKPTAKIAGGALHRRRD